MFIQHTCFFVQKRGVIVETPLVVFPTSYIENDVCWPPQTLTPPRFEFFPKSGKDPKATSCDATDATPGWPQADSLKEIQKFFSKNWVIFPTKNAWGKVGPEAYGNWNLSHPHLFFLIFFKMSNPKTPRTFRQEIGVSRLTWKLSKRFSLVMFAQCRGGSDAGRGFRVDIVDWLEGKGSYIPIISNKITKVIFSFMASTDSTAWCLVICKCLKCWAGCKLWEKRYDHGSQSRLQIYRM